MRTSKRNLALGIAVAVVWLAGSAPAANYYVDVDYTAGGGSGPNDPYPTIGAAVAAANAVTPGTRGAPAVVNLRLASGVYADVANGGAEDYSAGGGAAPGGGYLIGYGSLSPNEGILINVYGGYAGWDGGTGFDWTETARTPRSTIIDLQDADARAFDNGFGTHVSTGPIFDGLTFRNADHTGPGGAIRQDRGYSTTMFIEDCLFENNATSGSGGAVYDNNNNYSGWIRDCDFVDNTASRGGAVYFPHGGSFAIHEIADCTFNGNLATTGGGAVWMWYAGGSVSVPSVLHCTFDSNVGGQYGGGLFSQNARIVADQCVFVGNSAPAGAAVGGSTYHVGSYDLSNSLVYENTGGYAVQMEGANASGSYTIDMLHCTVADNPGGGV